MKRSEIWVTARGLAGGRLQQFYYGEFEDTSAAGAVQAVAVVVRARVSALTVPLFHIEH